MSEQRSTWRAGEWGLGVAALDGDDRVARVQLVCQPAGATWDQQRDLERELRAAIARCWMEAFWITPDGRLFFPEPHDEKDLDALGSTIAGMLPPVRYDQSALLDEPVEQRRRQGRYEPEPVDSLPFYWWWLADPISDKVVLGPDPAAPQAWTESPTEARRRLRLEDAPGGYIYAQPSSVPGQRAGWRVTTERHEPVKNRALMRRVVDAVKRREIELLSDMGPRPGRP